MNRRNRIKPKTAPQNERRLFQDKKMAPPVRLELTTSKLTASCSTIELQGIASIIVSNILNTVNNLEAEINERIIGIADKENHRQSKHRQINQIFDRD